MMCRQTVFIKCGIGDVALPVIGWSSSIPQVPKSFSYFQTRRHEGVKNNAS